MLALQFLFAIALEGLGALMAFGGVMALGVIATHDLSEIHVCAPELVDMGKTEMLTHAGSLAIGGFVTFVIGLWIATGIITS